MLENTKIDESVVTIVQPVKTTTQAYDYNNLDGTTEETIPMDRAVELKTHTGNRHNSTSLVLYD